MRVEWSESWELGLRDFELLVSWLLRRLQPLDGDATLRAAERRRLEGLLFSLCVAHPLWCEELMASFDPAVRELCVEFNFWLEGPWAVSYD